MRSAQAAWAHAAAEQPALEASVGELPTRPADGQNGVGTLAQRKEKKEFRAGFEEAPAGSAGPNALTHHSKRPKCYGKK